MTTSVSVPAKNLRVDQLVEIYHEFCKSYSFEPDEIDDKYLRSQGIRIIHSCSTLDYRPFMGAKFFAVGDDRHTEFWGYTSDKPQPKEARRFDKMVAELFK